MAEDLYCKIYVNSPLEIEELVGLISDLSEGTAKPFHEIETKLATIDCMVSHSRDDVLAQVSDDGFVFYKFYLDVEPVAGVARREYISHIRSLVLSLEGRGYQAVAACDFEDEL